MKSKGPKDRFTVVAWMNPEQFNKVYDCLFSDSLSKKRWAVDQISIWNTRCHPSLPTAVESTVGIVRAAIHDMLYQADKTFCQEEDIKLLYGMALIRFVNLTLEHHQKATKKIRLSFLAAKYNIPSWLLDLRNEASHSYYPSLSMLRFGAESALRHLKETFWSEEAAKVKPKVNLFSEREAEIAALINQYKSLQFQKFESEVFSRSLSTDFKAVLKRIAFFISHYRDQFIDILVRPGNFISSEDLKRLLKTDKTFVLQEDNLCLPIEIQNFWLPLLTKIYNKDLIPMFLEKLLLAQENCRLKVCQKTAIALAMLIFMRTASKSRLARCFQKRGLLLNTPSLVYACMKGSNTYSKELLSMIVGKSKNKGKYSNLFFMLALHQGYFIPEEDSSAKRKRDTDLDIVFSIEDVEEELNELRAKKMRSEEDVNIWSLPSVTMKFADIPIGGVINPTSSEGQNKLSDEAWKEQLKLEPSIDDDFIIINKNDGKETVEEITHDINTFPVTTRPENFDMVYRRKPNK